jgi:hypothetical protein
LRNLLNSEEAGTPAVRRSGKRREVLPGFEPFASRLAVTI